VGGIAFQSSAGTQPATPAAGDAGDTKPAPRRPWDAARDMSSSINFDQEVKYGS